MANNQYIKPTIATTDDSTYGLNTISATPGGEIQIVTTGETVNTIAPDRHIVVGDVLVSPGHYKNIPSDYHIDGNLTIEAIATGITIGSETYEYAGHVGISGDLLHCTGTVDIQGGLTIGSTTFTIPTYPSSGTSGGSIPMTGMIAWYKADVGVTVVGGSKVSQWADQSGNGFDLIAPSEKEPDAVGITLNSINVPNTVTNYSDKQLITAGSITSPGATGTIFIVAAQYAGDGFYGRFIDSVYSDNYHFSRNATLSQVLGGAATVDAPYGAIMDAADDTFYTFRIEFDGTVSTITRNGTVTSDPYTNGTPGAAQPLSMFTATGGAFPGKKAIAELIIYDDVLAPSDITAIESYLQTKWAHY